MTLPFVPGAYNPADHRVDILHLPRGGAHHTEPPYRVPVRLPLHGRRTCVLLSICCHEEITTVYR